MVEGQLSAEMISALAGMVLSLGFSYIPGLADWYNRLGANTGESGAGGTRKRLVMLALLVFVTAGAFVLACTGLGVDLGLAVSCDRPGAVKLTWAFLMAVIANQATYEISPRRMQHKSNQTIQP